MINPQFTTEEFLQQYKNLCHSSDKAVREYANSYILKLHKSEHAWAISQKLIYESPSAELQFIACQILYRKTREYFCDLQQQEQDQLKQFVLKLLVGNELVIQSLALKQLCCTWATIILFDKNMWAVCLQDLVTLMQSGKKQMEIGLDIMSQVAIETKEIMGKQKQAAIQIAFISQQAQIIQIFRSLLQLSDLHLLTQSISCIEAWSEFGLQLLDDIQLVNQILDLGYNSLIAESYDLFVKICQALSSLTKYSSKKSLVQNETKLNKLLPLLSIEEQNILGNIKLFIIRCAQDLSLRKIESKQSQFEVWRGFAEFSNRFCCDMMIIVILDQSATLFEVMLMITDHPARRVSYLTFEFWVDVRQVLHKRSVELMEMGVNIHSFYMVLSRVLQPVLNKCQLKSIKITQKFIGGSGCASKVIDLENQCSEITIIQSEDQEDEDDYLNGEITHNQGSLSAYDYREYAKDIFFCIYQTERDQKQSTPNFFIQIKQNLDIYQRIWELERKLTKQQFDSLITRTEAALFAVQTVLDDFLLDMNQVYVIEVVEFVLGLKEQIEKLVPQEVYTRDEWMNIIVKTSLQLFYEFSQQTGFTQQIFHQIINYIINYIPHLKLGPLASQALESISQIQKLPVDINLIQSLIGFYQVHYNTFNSYTHVENFISGLMNMSWALQDKSQTHWAFTQIYLITKQNFELLLTNTVSKQQMSNIINNILSILSWYGLHLENIIKTPLFDIPKSLAEVVVQPLIQILSQNYQQNDQMDQVLRLFKNVLRVCDYNTQTQSVNDILNLALKQIASDPIKKAHWLQLVSLAILRSDRNQQILVWLRINLHSINSFCLQQHLQWQDPDLVKYWVELLRHIISCDNKLLLSTPDFLIVQDNITKALLEINSYEMQREILIYIKYLEFIQPPTINRDLVINSPKDDEVYQQCLPQTVIGLFSSITQINPAMMSQFSQILVHITYQVSDKAALMALISKGLENCFSCSQAQYQILSKAIVSYAATTERGQLNRDLKLLLSSIRPSGENEINYMQLELQINRISRQYKNIFI